MTVAGARIPRGSRRSKALSTALLTLIALVVPMAGVAVANHGTRTLQLTPETDDNPVATTHTVTATLDAAADATSGTIEIDFEVNGPGDPGYARCLLPDVARLHVRHHLWEQQLLHLVLEHGRWARTRSTAGSITTRTTPR